MKKLFNILFFTCIAVFVSQCAMDIHEIEEIPGGHNIVIPDSIREGERGTLAAELTWIEQKDRNAAVDYITVMVYDSLGRVVADTFATKQEIASWSLAVPTGTYDMLVTANMKKDNGFQIALADKSEIEQEECNTTLPDANCTISKGAGTDHAWFGLVRANVTAGEHTVAKVNLQRLFASVSVTMINVPDLARMTVEFVNTAKSVNFTRMDNLNWGQISEQTVSVSVTSGVSVDSMVSCIGKMVLPTALNQESALMNISLKLADNSVAKAPVWAYDRLEAGQEYNIVLDYNTFMPPEIIIKQDGTPIKGAVKEQTTVDFSSMRTNPLGWAYHYAGYEEVTEPEKIPYYEELPGIETSSLGNLQPGYYVVRMTYGQKDPALYVYRVFGVTRMIVDPENLGKSQSLAQ